MYIKFIIKLPFHLENWLLDMYQHTTALPPRPTRKSFITPTAHEEKSCCSSFSMCPLGVGGQGVGAGPDLAFYSPRRVPGKAGVQSVNNILTNE